MMLRDLSIANKQRRDNMAVNVRDYIAENYGLFINGEFVKGSVDETIEVTNPATGETLSHITRAKDKDVDHAVKVARKRHLNHGH